MEIQKITINGISYRFFFININDLCLCVAEEKLENFIQDCIDNDLYDSVRWIDELYPYYVEQSVADTEDEEKIKQSILIIIDEE